MRKSEEFGMPKLKKASTKVADLKSTKRQANKKDQGVALHQALSNSLSQLNEYWKKQSDAAKKQISSARAELKKAQDKAKAQKSDKSKKVSSKTKVAQTDKAQQLFIKQQQALENAKLSLIEAKQQQQHAQLQAKKYAELSKTVTALEKETAKQIAQSNKAAKEEAKAITAKATNKATKEKTAKEKTTVAAAAKPKKAAAAKAKKTTQKPKKPASKTKAVTIAAESTEEEEIMDIFEEKPDFSDVTEQNVSEEQANYEDELDAERDELNAQFVQEEEYDEFND